MITTTNQYKVVTVSENTNSFGLRQHIMVARGGEVYKVCRSISPEDDQWKKGDLIDVPTTDFRNPQFEKLRCELVEQLPDAPPAVIREVFKKD